MRNANVAEDTRRILQWGFQRMCSGSVALLHVWDMAVVTAICGLFSFQLFSLMFWIAQKFIACFSIASKTFNASFFFEPPSSFEVQRCPRLPIFPPKLCERNSHWPILHEEKSFLLLSWARWQALMPARLLAYLLFASWSLLFKEHFFLAGKMKKKPPDGIHLIKWRFHLSWYIATFAP